jgi:hypothetical protein
MNEPGNQDKRRISADDLTLLAFGDLPADRVDDAERAVSQDEAAKALLAAMRRLSQLGAEDEVGPSQELIATSQATIRLALARKRRWCRLRILVGVGSVAAAIVVIVVIVATIRTPDRRTPVTIVESPKAPASQPAKRGLREADRRVLRQTIAQMRLEQTRDATWDRESAQLRRRVSRARFGPSRFGASPRRYTLLRQRIDRLSNDITPPPKTTRPAGSTRSPAPTKESGHA